MTDTPPPPPPPTETKEVSGVVIYDDPDDMMTPNEPVADLVTIVISVLLERVTTTTLRSWATDIDAKKPAKIRRGAIARLVSDLEANSQFVDALCNTARTDYKMVGDDEAAGGEHCSKCGTTMRCDC